MSTSADPSRLRRRHGQLLLAALMVIHLAWDMRAVLCDGRLGPTDTTVEEALHLRAALCRKQTFYKHPVGVMGN